VKSFEKYPEKKKQNKNYQMLQKKYFQNYFKKQTMQNPRALF